MNQKMNQTMNPPPEVSPPSNMMVKEHGAEETMRKKRTATVKTSDFQTQARKKSIRGPILRFSPYAWAKLLAFRDYGSTEIAGFGVAHGDDPQLIEDFMTVKQSCSAVTVAMCDEAVADYFDQQVDRGLRPEQFARVWLHTHPGSSAQPSATDEATFERVFGQCDWAIMAILACGGQTYARLRFGVGPGGQMLIPVQVDFETPFPMSDHDAWQSEYEHHVIAEPQIRLRHLFGEHHRVRRDARERDASEVGSRNHQAPSWQDEETWDIFDLNDMEALAELEAELHHRQIEEAMQQSKDEDFAIGTSPELVPGNGGVF